MAQVMANRMADIRYKYIEPMRSQYSKELFEKNMKLFQEHF